MKRLYKFLMPMLLLVAMALPWSARSQVTVSIGDGGTTTNSYLPTYEFYNYSLTQQLFTAQEIGMPGTITSFSFYTAASATRTLAVYMVNTTKTSFTGSTDWIVPTASDQVFSGSVTYVAGGWTTITLTNPFFYDGSSNLAIIVDDNTGSYVSSISKRVFTPTPSGNYALRVYSDGTNYDALAPTSYSGTTMTQKNQIQLQILPANMSCYPVRNLHVANINPDQMTLSWADTSNTGATYVIIDRADSSVLGTTVDTFYTIMGFMPDTTYNLGVFVDCGGGDSSMMASINVNTPPACPAPTLLHVDSLTSTSITISWTPGYMESQWLLSIGDSDVVVNASPYTITDLTLNTPYTLKLRALCDAGDSSAYTQISTRTLAGEPISQFPYTCGFEIDDDGNNEAINWVLENGTQTNQWFVGTPGAHNGTKGLYISNDNGTSNNYATGSISHVYAYATFNFTETGQYAISYDWRNQGESNYYDWLRVFLAPASQDFVGGNINFMGGSTYAACTTAVAPGWFELSGKTASPYTLAQSSTWQTVNTTFTITTPGTYKLVFLWSNDGSGGTQPPASVDNIAINILTCPAPVALTIDTLMPTAIGVHWTPMGDEDEWTLALGDSVIDGIQDTFYTVTGLEQYTLYTLKVRAVCGDEDSSLYSTAVTGRTTVSCPWPTNLTAAYVSSDSITVSWHRGGDEAAWEVVLGTSAPVEVYDTFYTFDNLSSNTPYTIKVRALCGPDDISAWTTLTVRTACGFISLPYFNGFENDPYYSNTTYANAFPYCWTRINDATSTTYNYYPYVTNSSSYVYNGSKGMYWYFSTSTTYANNEYVVLPEVDTVTTPMNTLELTFYAKTTATSSPYPMFIVGVMTDNENDSTFTPYDTINLTSAWTLYTVNFSNYTGAGDFIAIRCPRPSTSVTRYVGLDDVSLHVLNPCATPISLTGNATVVDSVVVTWVENGTATAWEVAYGAPGFNPDTATAVAVSETTYTFTNLNGGVSYDIYVRSDCGGAYSYWAGPLTVTPGSFIMSSTGAATISMCGGVIYDDGGPTGDYSASANYTLTIYPANPDSMLTFHGSGNMESNSWDHLRIYEGVGTGGTLLWENGSSTGTFTIPLDTCLSGPITITFSSDGSGQYSGFELFINCVGAPDCSPVEALTAYPTPTGALITWQPGFYGVYSGATLEYKADSVVDSWTSQPLTTGNYAVITGLEPNTDYNVRVTTDCEGFQGGVATVNFTTIDYGCAVIDSASTFNDTIANGSTTNSYIPDYSLYDYSLSQQIYTPAEIGHGGQISILGFKASAIATPDRTLEIYMGHTASATASSFLTPTDLTLVYSGSLSLVAGWNMFNLTTPFTYDGVQNLVVIVRNMTGSWSSSNTWIGTTGTTGVSRYVYQDDSPFSIGYNGGTSSGFRCATIFAGAGCLQQATCAAPAVAAVDVTTTTVTLAWAPGAGETSWNLYYRLAGTTAWSTPVVVTGSTYTVTGLGSGLPYEFKVENACNEGNFATTVEATTLCAAITLPYTEDFNGWGTGQLPNCWYNTGAYYTSSYSIISASQNMTGTTGGSVYMYSSDGASYVSRIILPELDSAYQMNQAQLVFNVKYTSTSYGNPTFEVGVMSDPLDLTTFVPVDTVTVQGGINQWEVFEVSMANYTGNGAYAAIQTIYPGTYFYCYLDDVTLEAIPTCLRPDSLTASNATTTTIDLAWHERGGASSWIIEYGPRGFQPGTGTTVVANTNPFTLTGLAPSYQGEYYVRSICSSADTGDYSRRPCAFGTTQIPATLPYDYDFENPTEWANWQTCSNHDNNWFRGTAVADSGSYSMYMSADGGVTYKPYLHNAVVNATAFRDIDFGPVDSSYTLTIRARAGGTTTGGYDGMIVLLADPSIATVPSGENLMTPWGDVRDLYQIMDVRTDTTWQTYTCSFDTIHGVHRMAFYWFNQNTQGNSSYPNLGEPVAVDNIHLDYSTCPRPVAVEAVNVGSATATLTWVGESSATYEVIYRVVGSTTNNFVTTNTNGITLTGLESTASYYVWVRRLCGGGDTSLVSDRISFATTLCDGAVIVATGDPATSTSTSYNAPVNNYYKYTLSETIIDSAELGGPMNITSIAYYFDYSSAMTAKTDVTIWLQPTNKTAFSSSSDAVALDTNTAVQVYHGNLNCSQGWNYFAFTTPYNYNGNGNVLVIVDDNSNLYNSSSYVFRTASTTAYKTLTRYSDSYNPDPLNPNGTSASSSYYQWRPMMQLISCGGSACPTPAVTADTIGETFVTINYETEANSVEVAIVPGAWLAPASGTIVSGDSTYTFTGLTGLTDYVIGVRAICGNSVSDWTVLPVTTLRHPCAVPGTPQVSGNTYDGATVTWTAGENETEWELKVFCNSPVYEHTYTVSDTPSQVVSGLDAATTYSVTVRAVCDSAWYSVWSDIVDLTTLTCPVVTGVTSSNVTATGATISWNSTNAVKYEIEYGEMGFQTGAGTTVFTTNTTITLNNLEEQSTYDVFVRGYCTENVAADWSERYRFNTPAAGNGIADVENSNVTLYPNPASSMVTIGGLEGESTVTVVDLNGREVYRDHTGANGHSGQATATGSVTIDVSGYAKGAYFVRVTGESTTAIRKLIVK